MLPKNGVDKNMDIKKVNEICRRVVKEVKMSKEKTFKYCEICFTQNAGDEKTKFHLYSDEVVMYNDEKYVCDDCLKFIHAMRKKAVAQVKNPGIDAFEGAVFIPAEEREPKLLSDKSSK